MDKYAITAIAVLFFCVDATAATHSVKTSGGDYTNPVTCLNESSPGDVCEMYDGTYSAGTLTGSGSSGGGYITLRPAACQTSVVINGDIAPGADGVEYVVIGGDVAFTLNGMIRPYLLATTGQECNHFKLLNFTLNNPDVNDDVGIWLEGNYVLLDGITFTNYSHDLIRSHGDYWVIRNNVGDDMTPYGTVHMDFAQFFCNDTGCDVPTHVLVEGNTFSNVSGADTHFLMGNDTGSGKCGLPFEYFIIRHNVVNHIGAQGVFFDTNTIADGQHDLHAYNNTFYQLWYGAEERSYSCLSDGVDYSSAANNIFYDSLLVSDAEGWAEPAHWSSDYQLFYSSSGAMTLDAPADGETNSVVDSDPEFVSTGSDFRLQQGSPAIDAGGPLTLVAESDTGSGAALVVNNAAVFCDGWGGFVDADYIAVGNVSNTAKIISIDYDTDTIILASSIIRKDGDPVWLYKKSDGVRVLYGDAPDIGAIERANEKIRPAISGSRIAIDGKTLMIQ